MIKKEKMRVFDHAGNAVTIDVTVIDDERDYAMIEEPPEPVITVTYDGGSWVVYGDENSEHPDFEEQWWPRVLYGGSEYGDEAKHYAKKWAKAVRGVWEEV